MSYRGIHLRFMDEEWKDKTDLSLTLKVRRENGDFPVLDLNSLTKIPGA